MTPPPTVTPKTEFSHDARQPLPGSAAGRLVAAVFSSVFVWILFWLALVDFSIVSLKPLKYVDMGGYVQADKNPLRIKLEKFLSPDCNPEVCVVGSSLAMSALACADALVYKKPFPTIGYGLHRYYESIYLEDKLSELTGQKHKVFNVSISGCMASDALAILNECLDAKPSIKMVVIMMSPRDLHDNAAARAATKGSIVEHLKVRFEPIHWQSILTSQPVLEQALSKVWQYFYQRSDYRRLLRMLACETLDRAADFQSAVYRFPIQEQDKLHFNQKRSSANDVMTSEMKRHDTIVFRGRYNPYDPQLLAKQFDYLERALKLCKSKNVVPIIVDMPVPAATLDIMPEQLKQDYSRNISSVCKREAANLVELQKSNAFNDNDFRDSIHPVGTGGKKIIDALAASLFQNNSAIVRLKQ